MDQKQDLSMYCGSCSLGYYQTFLGVCGKCSLRCRECVMNDKYCTVCSANRESEPFCPCTTNLMEDPATSQCVSIDNPQCPENTKYYLAENGSAMCV
jgi:hypothetical protein